MLATAMNAQIPPMQIVYVEVPNGLLDVAGNDASRLPFSYLGPVHYQQIYDASQFSKVPTGGSFVTRIMLRADCLSQWSFLVASLQVRLSITSKGPDQLSPTFADNIGPDETLVYGPQRYAPPPPTDGCPGIFDDGHAINLDVPFFYDPAKGHLLMDLRHAGIDWTGAPLEQSTLDAQTVSGDGVSRVASFLLGTNVTEVVDSTGLVTQFEFYSTPSIAIRRDTNGVVLAWPASPNPFRLQYTDQIGAGTIWQDYPGPIGGNGFFRELVLPPNSLGRAKFFRLFWDTPQPLAISPASPSLQVEAVNSP
jgi:hypothetical protein